MILSLDTETTTINKGHPFDDRNVCVCYSFASSSSPDNNGARLVLGHRPEIWKDELDARIDAADLIVGFNFKFDFHWFRKIGIDLKDKPIYDTQIGYYIYKRQTVRWPSLDEVCADLGLGQKLDVVKTEYWDKGIDTKDIPWPILRDYATHDAVLTLEVYHRLMELLTPAQIRLWSLAGQDQYVLEEMEWNGLQYDKELCEQRAEEIRGEISKVSHSLSAVYPDVPINFNSTDHLSAFLYGGIVKEDRKELIGVFKTGARAGQPKYKNVVVEHQLPRLVQPLKGTELQKEGLWETNAKVLKKLRGSRSIQKHIENILNLARLDKLLGTYYVGLPKKALEMNWLPMGTLHGAFHQISTATGRLSSSDPNLQNFSGELQDIFVSRFK